MKTLLLFNQMDWDKQGVNSWLENLDQKFKLRFGFGHILAVCDEELVSLEIPTDKKIISVLYDKERELIQQQCLIKDQYGTRFVPTIDVLEKELNLGFDLSNFGFITLGGADITRIYDQLIKSASETVPEELLANYDCRKLIDDPKINNRVKKLLLDLFSYTVSCTHSIVKLKSADSLVGQYSTLLFLSFLTRMQYEKLFLLIAEIDPQLSFNKIDGSKKIKSTFRKLAVKSEFPLTKRLLGMASNIEILDDNFRTPETHKMGRLLGLIHQGHFETLMNEILSFHNKANSILTDAINFVDASSSIHN